MLKKILIALILSLFAGLSFADTTEPTLTINADDGVPLPSNIILTPTFWRQADHGSWSNQEIANCVGHTCTFTSQFPTSGFQVMENRNSIAGSTADGRISYESIDESCKFTINLPWQKFVITAHKSPLPFPGIYLLTCDIASS